MKAQNNRIKVQAGATYKRRAAPTTPGTASRSSNVSRNTPRSSGRKSGGRKSGGRKPGGRKSGGHRHGARVIWILIFVGGVIATGFLLAQRSQINAHQLKRAEQELKSELDTLSSQQRYLAFQKERAFNTQETDRMAKESGLVQPRFDQAASRQILQSAVAKSQAKTADKSITQSVAPPAKPVTKQAIKSSAKPANSAKPIKAAPALKAAKVTGKPAQTARAKKDDKKIARNQAARKAMRR